MRAIRPTSVPLPAIAGLLADEYSYPVTGDETAQRSETEALIVDLAATALDLRTALTIVDSLGANHAERRRELQDETTYAMGNVHQAVAVVTALAAGKPLRCQQIVEVWGPNEGCAEFMDRPDEFPCGYDAVRRVDIFDAWVAGEGGPGEDSALLCAEHADQCIASVGSSSTGRVVTNMPLPSFVPAGAA